MKKIVVILIVLLLVGIGIYLNLRGKAKPADSASHTTVAKIEKFFLNSLLRKETDNDTETI